VFGFEVAKPGVESFSGEGEGALGSDFGDLVGFIAAEDFADGWGVWLGVCGACDKVGEKGVSSPLISRPS
jgi:hypothetical protein